MIGFDSFITDTLSLVDNTTHHYVAQAYSNLGGYINGLVMTLATFYIMWFGYQVLYQKIKLDTMTMARYLSVLIIVIMLTTHWSFYNLFVYNTFTNEPNEITKALSGGGPSPLTALNSIWATGCIAASKLFAMGGWKNIQYLIYAGVVYTATFINCLIALGLFVYSKMALAALLGIGPLFILLMLFESTRELTTGWIRGLLNYAIIPIITTTILLMTNTLAQQILPAVDKAADQGNIKPDAILVYLALAIINGFLLKQVLSIAALLSNSLSLEALGNSITMTRNAMQKTGKTLGNTGKAARGGYRGARHLARRYSAWKNRRRSQ